MRPMLINPDTTARAQAVVRYAQAHPFYLAELQRLLTHPEDAPGNTTDHVLHIPVGFRCVFTIDQQPGGWMRHLSMSVDVKGHMPNLVAVQAAMALFGFQHTLEQCGRAGHVWAMHEQLDSVNVLEVLADGQ